MYKLLLCWRYLRTRYLALVCIVSVMLGVATLIVVNSVMSGFSTKLRDRLHGLLSDVVIEYDIDGFPDPHGKMQRILADPFLRDRIAAMTPTLEIFAMLQFQYQGVQITKPVRIIGIDPKGRAEVGGFAEFLVKQKNRPNPVFELDEEGRRRFLENQRSEFGFRLGFLPEPTLPGAKPPPDPPPSQAHVPHGAILGFALAHYRERTAHASSEKKDVCMLHPGDDVVLTTVSGQKLSPVYDRFTVCDYFKSEMSEYDSNYVFVPLDHLQHLRTMQDRVTSIQIKLKNYADAKPVVDRLKEMFGASPLNISTWEEKQGPLLAAIQIEKGILNVLLFLIIAVAGFGILAIFSMIVVEKTRDIGVLKALGASNGGVMKIFLGYGLLLGVVGAGLGTILGLSFAANINPIEKCISKITGGDIFDRSIYYFDKIPTDIQAWSVFLVNLGAIGIAVLFSVLPALRAAKLHPVRALRYE
jgi:lipoprotein-releasing system permease protein